MLFLATVRQCCAVACVQGKKLVFVTNNSTKSRKGYLGKFTSLGLKVSAEEIYSSSYAAAAYLESINFPKNKKVSRLCSPLSQTLDYTSAQPHETSTSIARTSTVLRPQQLCSCLRSCKSARILCRAMYALWGLPLLKVDWARRGHARSNRVAWLVCYIEKVMTATQPAQPLSNVSTVLTGSLPMQ